MTEERERNRVTGPGRPTFSSPQPLIAPPGGAAPGDAASAQGQGYSAAHAPVSPPLGPSATGPDDVPDGAPAPRPPGFRSEQPTLPSARAAHRPKSPPPPPSGAPAWDGPPPFAPRPVAQDWITRARMLPGRMSIRVRLTLTYGGLFFVAGALLLFVIYSFVARAIYDSWPEFPVPLSEDAPAGWVASIQNSWAAMRSQTIAAAQHQILIRSLLALAGVGILALILGYFVADRALRPIQKMTSTARKLSETSLAHERIDLEGPNDEIKELADTFDAMLTRLGRAFDAQRRFVDNASHELRTPLAINRTVLEVALGDPHASEDLKVLGRTLLGTNARNEHLIEGLLLLARSERELAVRKPVDLLEVGRTVTEQHAAMAEEAGVTVHTDLRPALTMGDPVLVERLVANLVENAVKYNIPSSGQLWLRTGMVDGAPVVQVANTGQHVPAYEVDDLFEPFRRLNSDRVESARGAGLGLSIVRAVVRAHQGIVSAVPREGGGLVVTVRLPAA
ncbi:sensor protein CutS [Sphaerisporangium krabiense]|uniref:histidine kinase n=1 Tax=Sphaerisporangium krabiense TaxID=763782 RepID=A0A7W9DT87_9ACTN|nr:HAMP domain-containing sensor histidine kinase [Sphaerisporangium krabiense]MBB5630381.1 signal transduction histidine kinase [Sphaerisporangium krabiense]GII62664.1 sensor protein CutS [Sphaerisporangium krabiense]